MSRPRAYEAGLAVRDLPTGTLNVGLVADALVQSNFGSPQDLFVCGVPVGRMTPEGEREA